MHFDRFIRSLPRRVVSLDVETTGLGPEDRVVSVGMVRLDAASVTLQDMTLTTAEWFCNPGRRSHPRAFAVHGLTDTFLSQQPPFPVFIDIFNEVMESAELVVGHNAEFDLSFLATEFARCGRRLEVPPAFCTYELTGSRLDEACAAIGLSRTSETHCALEDAWLALMVFLESCGAPAALVQPFPSEDSALLTGLE